MSSEHSVQLATKAEKIYKERLKEVLEASHMNEFVAVEPESGDYFLGKTPSEATQAAKKSHPDRLTHLMRVGHQAALHFGMQIQ